MKLNTRYSNHPNDVKHYTTEELREHFLIEDVFVKDEANLTYSHNDRIIAGGIQTRPGDFNTGSRKRNGS